MRHVPPVDLLDTLPLRSGRWCRRPRILGPGMPGVAAAQLLANVGVGPFPETSQIPRCLHGSAVRRKQEDEDRLLARTDPGRVGKAEQFLQLDGRRDRSVCLIVESSRTGRWARRWPSAPVDRAPCAAGRRPPTRGGRRATISPALRPTRREPADRRACPRIEGAAAAARPRRGSRAPCTPRPAGARPRSDPASRGARPERSHRSNHGTRRAPCRSPGPASARSSIASAAASRGRSRSPSVRALPNLHRGAPRSRPGR